MFWSYHLMWRNKGVSVEHGFRKAGTNLRSSCGSIYSAVEATGNENISSARICGMDESVLTAVQKPARIFACRGQNNNNKKSWLFNVCRMRGTRNSSNMCQLDWTALMFLRVRFSPSLYYGAPPGTVQLYLESGYMVGELFVQWLPQLMSTVKPNVQERFIWCLTGVRGTRICMLLNV
jgi:hypothetical protein